jgi:hypothetical protein
MFGLEGDLTGIHEVRHSQRMPDLEMEVVAARLGASQLAEKSHG